MSASPSYNIWKLTLWYQCGTVVVSSSSLLSWKLILWYHCGTVVVSSSSLPSYMKAYIVIPVWYRCGNIIIIAVIHESLHCDTSVVPLWYHHHHCQHHESLHCGTSWPDQEEDWLAPCKKDISNLNWIYSWTWSSRQSPQLKPRWFKPLYDQVFDSKLMSELRPSHWIWLWIHPLMICKGTHLQSK